MADAGATKNKRTARQYIQPELARELQSHVGKKLRGAIVFDLPHACTMADMLREDLEAARQAWLKTIEDPQERLEADESDFLQSIDSEGERIDFHSLRHTCATWLIHAGADVKTIHSVIRHADIKLTLGRYVHLFPGLKADAVARLRGVFCASEMLLATGTDESGTRARLQRAGCFCVRDGAGWGGGAHDGRASCHYGENLEFAKGTRGFSGKDASESGGTRTLDPRIKSPMKT